MLLSVFESLDDYGPMWRAFHRVFPAETKAMFEEVATKYAKGGNGSAIAITRELIQRGAQLLQSNRRFMRDAPDERLQAFAASQAGMLRGLRVEDVTECAYASQNGWPPQDAKPGSVQAMIRMTIAELNLIEGGRDTPAVHGALSAKDVSVVIAAARAAKAPQEGLDAWEFGALWTRPPKEQCDTVIAIDDALSTVSPPLAGGFVEATLLSGAN